MLNRIRFLFIAHFKEINVCIFCVLLQIISANYLVKDFTTPNGATLIAKNILSTNEYQGGGSNRFRGQSESEKFIPRYYNLPGEALYLAFCFRFLKPNLHRYIHLPITIMLVIFIMLIASHMYGNSIGALAGLLATIQP